MWCESVKEPRPQLRASVSLEVCPLQRGSDAFEDELSKVTAPDSAAAAHFPSVSRTNPSQRNSCGYLLRREASEKMRSGQGGRRERDENKKTARASGLLKLERPQRSSCQNYMLPFYQIKHFVRVLRGLRSAPLFAARRDPSVKD